MCAPCEIILNEVNKAASIGESIHEAVSEAVSVVIDDLDPDTQNSLSKLDVAHIRAVMDLDRKYFEELVGVLSKHAGEDFGGG